MYYVTMHAVFGLGLVYNVAVLLNILTFYLNVSYLVY